MTDQLPTGFVVRLNRDVRVEDEGASLVGGWPTRALYLREAARALIVDRTITVSDPRTRLLAGHLLEAGMADPDVDAMSQSVTGRSAAAVTVVVPARDRAQALARLLASLGADARVVVVDDCSVSPRAVADVARAYSAELVTLRRNVGPAGARNAGLQLVRTEFVAFVDSDMVLNADTLPRLLRHFADPRLALVAPRILGLEQERANWIGRYEDARSSLDMGRDPSLVRPLSPLAWLPAACMVARVDALGDGFGEGMRVAEDVDLVWRLGEQGWRIRYEPAVRVRHEHRVHLGSWLARKAFYGTGAQLLAERHPSNVASAVFSPWSAALVVALLVQRPWSVPISVALTGFAATRIARRLARSRAPLRTAGRLAAAGAVSGVFQCGALLLRHWWPAIAVGCVFSRRLRRATLAAAVVDVAMEYSRTRPKLDPVRFGLLRRLDDLAYGSGVWFGAFRGGSIAALKPMIIGKPKRARE